MKKLATILGLAFWVYLQFCDFHQLHAQSPLFNSMKWSVPNDLSKTVLLVPKYEEVYLDENDKKLMKTDKKFREQVEQFNHFAQRTNEYILKEVKQHYHGKFLMVKFSELSYQKSLGNKYYLDCVIMPKQFHEPEPKAMKATFEAFANANEAFVNHNEMFHYYFYLRDLNTNDIYLSHKFEGEANMFDAMSKLLKRLD